MKASKTIVEQAYIAFNKRDIDGALLLMTEDVSWPKASEGGKVVGKDEIRAYWTRQWGEFDPHVEPLAMTEGDEGKIDAELRSGSNASYFFKRFKELEDFHSKLPAKPARCRMAA